MKSAKGFYEEYWQRVERERGFRTREGASIQPRMGIAAAMVAKKAEVIYCIDVGCGDGYLGKLLREKFGEGLYLVGCDISEAALNSVTPYYDKTFQIDFDRQQIAKEIPGEKFDYIFCLETLEHLFRPDEALKQFKTILKEDGEIIVSFPNIAWYRYRMELLRGKFPRGYTLFHPGEHIQQFTLHSFKELIEGEGFVAVEMDGQFVFPKFFRPTRIFAAICKKFPNLFGYQLVIKAKLREEKV